MSKRLLFILSFSFIVSGFSFAQTKTVTNQDLEKFRQKRLNAEREYRENYEKLGFPSPEELERRREEDRFETEETLLRQKEQKLETENDFRAQARALSAEIASVDAQINYINSLLPANLAPTEYFTGGIAPFGYTRSGRSNSIWRGDATGRVFLGGGAIYAPNPRAGFGNFGNLRRSGAFGNRSAIRFGIGAGNAGLRGRIDYGVNAPYYRTNKLRRGYRNNQFYGYFAPVFVDKYDYTQDDLLVQLRGLAQARAGLYAEYNLLREEANRAGFRID